MKHKRLILSLLAPLAFCIGAWAQQETVSGKVYDNDGMALPGVAVYYDGTATGTTTDADGAYSIRKIKGKTLIFNCYGMKEERVAVKDRNLIDIFMTIDSMVLDDAVVIGYGTISRKDLTGSVASVKAEEIMKTGSNNALGALQGHVAGLSITSQSGEPGAGFSIKIRGNNSINAGTAPLFVIDGMQMDVNSGEVASSSATGSGTYDPTSFLNPADIESVEVLKDASATAIYGARGANGVVIITTKGASKGHDKTSVNFDSTFGISEVPRHIDMLDAQSYMDYRFYRKDYGYYSFGKDTNGDGITDMPLDASEYRYYDWQDIMYRKALSQNYTISMNAMVGGGKTQIASSIGYLDQQGLIHGNTYNRYTGRIKIDHNISDKLKWGATVNFGRTISQGAVTSGGGSLGYSGMVQYIYLERPIEKYTSDEEEYTSGVFGLKSLMDDETYRRTVYDKLTANTYFSWEIAKGLSFRANASGGTSDSNLMEYYSSRSKWGYSWNGRANNSNVRTYNYNISAQLNYKADLRHGHHFDAMLGGEMTYYNNSSISIKGYDFSDESTGAFNIGKAGIIEAPDMGISDNSKMSMFARVNYNWRSRYYLTLNMRADGSSKFYAGNRVGWFPSGSFAWRVNEEPWMKSTDKWLDNLKLRLSVGASGNDRISNYAALATLGTNYYASSGNEIMGMAPTASANPDLKWETTYQYNAGIDLSILKERINLTADVYYKDTRDMLYRATLSAQSGYTTQWQNLGRVENKGLEIAISTHNIEKRDFSWSTSLTFDMSRNKVLDIGGIEYTTVNIGNGQLSSDISRIVVGQPIGIGWGYVWDGNYQLDDFIITKGGRQYPSDAVTSANYDTFTYTLKEDVVSIAGKNVMPGDRKYKDIYGDDNVITTEDRTKISDSNPDWSAGLGNTFTIGNFDLNIFLEGTYGRSILNEFKLRSESGESGGTMYNNLTQKAWDNRWTPENASNTYSRLRNQTNTYCSSYYVEDGSYLRLKTLAVGYTLGAKALSKVKLRSLRIGFNIDNVWCLTGYSGMDPDVSSSNSLFTGFDRMSYPKARTYSLNLNIGF